MDFYEVQMIQRTLLRKGGMQKIHKIQVKTKGIGDGKLIHIPENSKITKTVSFSYFK